MPEVAAVSVVPDAIESVPVFLVIGSLSAMIFSMGKAGFGGGVGMLAVPLMIYACGDSDFALGLMLPMLIVADYVAVIAWWRRWEIRQILQLLPGVVFGIAGAWLSLYVLKGPGGASTARADMIDAALKIAVGGIALVFVGLRVHQVLRKKQLAFRPVWWQAGFAGTAAGYTSTLAHAAGPITTMYLLPQNRGKERFVATSALFFWTTNQLKLVPYFFLRMIRYETLGAGLVLVPAIAAGAVLGAWLHRKVDARQFQGVVYVLLTLAGADLVRKGAATLWAG